MHIYNMYNILMHIALHILMMSRYENAPAQYWSFVRGIRRSPLASPHKLKRIINAELGYKCCYLEQAVEQAVERTVI